MTPRSFNRVSIDANNLQHNYLYLAGRVAKKRFLAMVKADAYGHGMIECSRSLEEVGCSVFGVAELNEAVMLRESGIKSTIFSMVGFYPADAQYFIEYTITPVVFDGASLEALSAAAVRMGKDITVHLKADTGMSRLGTAGEEFISLLEKLDSLAGLSLGGICSHFPCADEKASPETSENYRKFKEILNAVGKRPGLVNHIANSGGTLYFPETSEDMVRCGISLYGYYPDGRDGADLGELRPVMSFTTRVVQVKEVPAGTGISYGLTHVTSRQTRLAVLPIGYEDGFSRNLSNCGEVLIRGKRAPVLGRVCMNLCMVDVTDIADVCVGDEVVILGRQGVEHITADEIASKSGTINYEVLCMIGNNNEREY